MDPESRESGCWIKIPVVIMHSSFAVGFPVVGTVDTTYILLRFASEISIISFRFHKKKLSLTRKGQFKVKHSSLCIRCMVFRLDGCSFDYAHTWSKSAFQFVEGIRLHRKSHQIGYF